MTLFDIDGRSYRARPFDADVHVSLMLRLSPVFAALAASGPSLLAARRRHAASETPDPLDLLSDLASASSQAAEKLASLDRTGDAALVIASCLQAADQRAEDKWHPVMTKAGSISNRDNATYIAKLKITLQVIRVNFNDMLLGMGIDMDALMDDAPDAGV